MKCQKLSKNEYLIKLEIGDDIISSLKKFCEELEIEGGVFEGVGALQKANISVYDFRKKVYMNHEIDEECEIISLIGNVAKLKEETIVHAHIGLGKEDLSQLGGHVNSGCIVNVAEIHFKSFDEKIEREKDPATNLNLLKL